MTKPFKNMGLMGMQRGEDHLYVYMLFLFAAEIIDPSNVLYWLLQFFPHQALKNFNHTVERILMMNKQTTRSGWGLGDEVRLKL